MTLDFRTYLVHAATHRKSKDVPFVQYALFITRLVGGDIARQILFGVANFTARGSLLQTL